MPDLLLTAERGAPFALVVDREIAEPCSRLPHTPEF